MTTKQVLPVVLAAWGGLALWSLKSLRGHGQARAAVIEEDDDDDLEDEDEEDDRGLTAVWSQRGEAFAVGERGAIYHSSDDGRVWMKQDANVEEDLHAVFGVDDRRAERSEARCLRGGCAAEDARVEVWAVGDEGRILHQRAPGVWESQASGVDEDLHAVWGTRDELWVAGNAGVVLHSRDRGATWHRVDSGTEEDLRAVAGAPGGVYVSGDNGVIKKLTATQAVSTTGGSPDPQG